MAEEKKQTEEISLIETIENIKEWIYYLKRQWGKIFIAGILGGLLGFVYAYYQPITYTAKTTFVVEESKSGGGLSSLASLAGQFGVELGSNVAGGLISGDNILLYFKSESLIRDVLLSNWDSNTSFADRYLIINDLKKRIEEKSNIKNFNIPSTKRDQAYIRLQDSVLQKITDVIIKSELSITKTDKKAGFLELSTTMKNEEFCKRFNDQLVRSAIDKYLVLKTERQKKTVQKLQDRADSISRLLNLKTSVSVSLQTSTSTMDVNPLYKASTSLATELTLREKTILGAIYVEVVKNLEMAKFTLSQETPVIQIVNEPLYPLVMKKQSKLKTAILFGFLLSAFMIVVLVIKRWFKLLVLEK